MSPDDTILALPSHANQVHLWDTKTWQEERSLKGFLLACYGAAFSPDGTRLITGSSGQQAVKLWDTQTWQELLTLPADGTLIQQIALAADGHTLGASDQDGTLHLWPAPSMNEIQGRLTGWK